MISLPVIDISPFLRNTKDWDAEQAKTADAIADACKKFGFFYLIGHGIPSQERDVVLSLARDFFSQPEEHKTLLAVKAAGVEDGDGARGYQRTGENITQGRPDWHEGIDFYRPVNKDSLPPYGLLFGVNKWPSEYFQQRYLQYVNRLLQLGRATIQAMALALGEDRHVFDQLVDQSFWVLRAIGYPPLSDHGDREGISCGEHTDYGCLTFLLADDTKGALQVLHPNGQWIVADPLPGAYVVNIGDAFNTWSNGEWRATSHRVIHNADNYRVSVPFFFEPNFDARISPLPSASGRSNEKMESFEYGQHLLQKISGNFSLSS